MERPSPHGSPTTVSRRRLLAAGSAAGLGSLAGCLGLFSSREPVEPEEPPEDLDVGSEESEDPEDGDAESRATPGEFYYLLEDNGIEVEQLLREDNDLILFYYSDAETPEESDEEIGLIYQIFRQALVARGSEIEHVYTEIVNPFDGQVQGWGMNADWARRHDEDEMVDGRDVWNMIEQTKVYEDDEE